MTEPNIIDTTVDKVADLTKVVANKYYDVVFSEEAQDRYDTAGKKLGIFLGETISRVGLREPARNILNRIQPVKETSEEYPSEEYAEEDAERFYE